MRTGTPRLLDLFCGAGGAGMGYHRAGFEVVGVDLHPQPRYPFEFHQADALTFPLDGFDAIHASPPCQGYTELNNWLGPNQRHAKLIDATRERLQAWGLPYIIENVMGARREMPNAIMLCGSMFGLGVQRHRLFESSHLLFMPPMRCDHSGCTIGVYGDHPRDYTRTRPNGQRDARRKPAAYATAAQVRAAMGIDWMTIREICESIPPAYTEFLGRQLLALLAVASH